MTKESKTNESYETNTTVVKEAKTMEAKQPRTKEFQTKENMQWMEEHRSKEIQNQASPNQWIQRSHDQGFQWG